MRKEFCMSEDQLKVLHDACKPTRVMYIAGGIPIGGNPQENANNAWSDLGKEMGFDGMTAVPIENKGDRYFTAEEVQVDGKLAPEPRP